jgi:hypothetical protein
MGNQWQNDRRKMAKQSACPMAGQALCCVILRGPDQPMRMKVGFDCQMVRKSTTVPGLDASIMVLPPA